MKFKWDRLPKENITVKDIIRELQSSRVAFEKMRNQGKDYDDILNKVLDAEPGARIGDIQKSTNLKPHKFKKLLEALYQDFLDKIETDSSLFHFNETECYIHLEGYKGTASFACRLPMIPRVGESVDMPFLRSQTGCTGFYVSDVTYQFEDTKVVIFIQLKSGRYNHHFVYSKDQAIMEKRLGFMDAIGKFDSEIEEILNNLYKR